MAANKAAPSLGVKIVREHADLPKTRPERISLINEILNAGGVQRLVVDIDDGISIRRAVRRTPEDGPEVLASDLLASAMNVPMEEYPRSQTQDPLMYVLQAFVVLKSRSAKPLHFLVCSRTELRRWLAVDPMVDVSELFSFPVHEHPDVPADVLLLVGRSLEFEEELAYSVKLFMDPKPAQKGKKK